MSTKETVKNLHRTETALKSCLKASKFARINVPSAIVGNQNSAICLPLDVVDFDSQLMVLSQEALGVLLNARSTYIDLPDYSVPDWHSVIVLHTVDGSPEHAAWIAHIESLTTAMAAKITLPDPPGINPAGQPLKKKGTATAFPTSEHAERHAAIRAQRILDLEGAAATGDTGPSRTQPQRVGRKRDKLVDDLIIEEEIPNKDPNSKSKTTIIVYCIACDQDTKFRNPNRIKEHALSCKNLAELFPSLLTKVIKECGERGKGTGKLLQVRTKAKQGVVPAPSVAGVTKRYSPNAVAHSVRQDKA
ncbi:hypothetical protein DFH08DRAFT_809915 [Mycena albidolilacea]|uniref:Uncharacterized protein n=1 Tax=Mycena albidolilacea TaxID=1033008 RepID=A0AAD6ZYP1_9AGAR|nr:hypothetical protein DFH08DRAFT_809915 [Mycena albidolilacea]